VRKIDEEQVTWQEFQKHFKEKYLIEHYYDEKAKEFHELRLGTLTMDECVKRFTSLLRYVPYMQEEKPKIQWLISNLPNFMKEKLEFGYPRTMDDVVQKACICYQQIKQKNETPKGASSERIKNLPLNREHKAVNGRSIQQRTFGKLSRNLPKDPTYTENRQIEGISKHVTNKPQKQPLQC